MKQVNFSHAGGFPLEQETLERLQTAYRSELFEALKGHFSIQTGTNYTVVPATIDKKGWAIIHQNEKDQKNPDAPEKLVGILYPIISGTLTGFLKTTRTETNLIYGTGESQTAYYDYEAEYSPAKYDDTVIVTENGEVQTIKYYVLKDFETITDIHTIDTLLASIKSNIDAIEANINVIEGNINAIEANIDVIEGNVTAIKGDITGIKSNITAIETNIDVIEGDVTQINGYLAKALVDTSTPGTTNLSLNYQSNWTNTHVGGKIYLDNTNTSTEDFSTATTSSDSLLITDSANQVLKSNNLLDSLLKRITKLETQPATAIPYGIVAIWGKPERIPEGWEEYIPMKGKMPVGHQTFTAEEKSDALDGDGGNGFSYYRDYYGTPVFPFETLGSDGGRMSKKLSIDEMPNHGHDWLYSYEGDDDNNGRSFDEFTFNPGSIPITDSKNPIGKTGGSQSFSILNPYKVVQFIVYTGRPSDKTAPTAPTLTAPAAGIGTTSVYLNWSGSTDEFGVTEYVLYGNAISPIQVGNTFNRTIYGLAPGTPYTFYVVAKDAAGNTSASSNVVEVTTSDADLIAPTTPTGLTCYAPENGYLTVEWNPSTDNVGVTRYQVWRRTIGGTSQLYLGTPDNTCTVYGTANTTYYFKVMAFDAAGNFSAFSSEVSGTVTSGGGGGCFDIESLVTMASGQSKKLKNIEIGDKLLGYSFPNEIDESAGDYFLWNGKLNEASKADVTVVNKRASTQPDYYEIKTADATIKVTGEHPLLVTEDGENLKWLSVKNVTQSMLLIDKTGKTKVIESIVFKEEPLEVILLDVEDVDNYVISGIVAHNNKPEEQQ